MNKKRGEMNQKIVERATQIYLSSGGTLERAYEQAKNEILLDGVPKEVQDLFFNLGRR